MTLKDVILMVDRDLTIDVNTNKITKRFMIDTRPDSVYKITICFMCEEETWLTCNIRNEILVPWYDCEVLSFQPGDEETLEVWLKDEEYLINKYPEHLYFEKEGEDA